MNLIFAETFFNDVLLNSEYANAEYRSADNPTFIKTLGFYSVGDGGAAIYKIVDKQSTSGWVSDSDYEEVTPNGVLYCFGHGFFWLKNAAYSFELVPQNGRVIAEQIGVLSDDENWSNWNRRLLDVVMTYASQKALVVQLSDQKTYYLNPFFIALRSNTFLDGNNSKLIVTRNVRPDITALNVFTTAAGAERIKVSNLSIEGRTRSQSEETAGGDGGFKFHDQGFFLNGKNITLYNVHLSNFEYAIKTDTYAENTADYVVPEIKYKNFLFDNCTLENVSMGLNFNEVDGIIIKNSKIYSHLSPDDTHHNLYLGANCFNVRVNNCYMGNVYGDAIHKFFPFPYGNMRGDESKNHFYTDIAIHDANSALLFGRIVDNVMCDSAFATYVSVVLEAAAATNIIISNSDLSQTRTKSDFVAFLYVQEACRFWMQNTDVYYVGQHRRCDYSLKDNYYQTICEVHPERRAFVGKDINIHNYLIKFTGCNIVSSRNDAWCFFELPVGKIYDIAGTKFEEYWDNSFWNVNTIDQSIYRVPCINSLHSGITIRNSYLTNSVSPDKSPFRFWCLHEEGGENNICPAYQNCKFVDVGRTFPWVRLENSVFDSFGRDSKSGWDYLVQVNSAYSSVNDAINSSNSYVSNCYKFGNDVFTGFNNLMAI